MKILITGGAGFIGSHLTSFLLKQEHEVTVIDNLITGSKKNLLPFLKHPLFQFYEADIVDGSLDMLPSTDVIFHLASPASPVQYQKYAIETLRTNAEGTYRILEYGRKNPDTVFLLASTSEVYGDPLEHPQTEGYWGNVNPNGNRSCYDEAKRYAEALTFTYHRKYNMDIRVARIFNTYGPNMDINDGRIISNFITQALTAKPLTIHGDGSQTRSLCYVSDMVEGLTRLAFRKGISGEVINIGNPYEQTVLEIANLITEMTQSNSETVYTPIDEDDPKRRKPNISKAIQILDWKPTIELKDGLNKTINYFRKVL